MQYWRSIGANPQKPVVSLSGITVHITLEAGSPPNSYRNTERPCMSTRLNTQASSTLPLQRKSVPWSSGVNRTPTRPPGSARATINPGRSRKRTGRITVSSGKVSRPTTEKRSPTEAFLPKDARAAPRNANVALNHHFGPLRAELQ